MILRNRQPNSGTKPTCPTWVAQKKTKNLLQVFRTRGSNIDPAFPGNSLCEQISSDPNFRKIYFLITQASQYHYQRIPGNSPGKIFATEIHREFHPVSTHIPVTHQIARYFTRDFSCNPLIPKLPSTSTRGLQHV